MGSVDERGAQQAGTGNLLLLKGNAWGGNYGAWGMLLVCGLGGRPPPWVLRSVCGCYAGIE